MEKKLNIQSTVTPKETISYNQWCMKFNVSGMTPIQVTPTFANDMNMGKLKNIIKKRQFTS